MNRTAAVVALAAALASPAFATTLYVPFADRLESRAPQQRTELRLSNSQSKVGQSVTYRIFVDGKAGAVKNVPLGAGQSRSVAPSVPMGSSGLIELNVPNGVDVSARLQVERSGKAPGFLDIPAFVADSAAPAGSTIRLTGLEQSSARQSAFSVLNLGDKAATCSVRLEDANGKAIGAATELQLPGKSSHREANAFAGLTSNTIADGVARISCNSRFWTYALVEETATGETALVTPSLELTPTKVSNAVTPTAATTLTFSKLGTFLVSSNTNLNWHYTMFLGSTLTFHKVIVDYDFFVNVWDPQKPGGTHEVLWFQRKVKDWSGMMAYINARQRGDMRYATNYNFYFRGSLYPGLKQKTNYHMRYSWDGVAKTNAYVISTPSGTPYTRGSVKTGASTFTVLAPFIGMGGQTSCKTCPESKTPGWAFSNLIVQFVP